MGVIDFAEAYREATQAGQTIVDGNTVRVITDNGDDIGEAVLKVVQGNNGTASNVWTMVQTAVQGVVTTGVSYLAISLPTAFTAIAPCLGITAGVGIYEITSGDTDFHNRLLQALMDEGKTIGGKILAYWNGENLGFDRNTIETFKQAMLDAGMFEYSTATENMTFNGVTYPAIPTYNGNDWYYLQEGFDPVTISAVGANVKWFSIYPRYSTDTINNYAVSTQPFYVTDSLYHSYHAGVEKTYNGQTYYMANFLMRTTYVVYKPPCEIYDVPIGGTDDMVGYIVAYGTSYIGDWLQEGANYPDPDVEFPLQYPTWTPWEYPQTTPDPTELPTIFPVKYPEIDPDPYPTQDPAQNPDHEIDPIIYPIIIPDFDLPNPNPDYDPEQDIEIDDIVDPDEAIDPETDEPVEPDPIDPTPDPDVPDDPIDPNKDPTETPVIPPIVLPDSVSSNKLFTVYNPSLSQLNALGAYLWDSSLMETIKKIWQNPLDGVISLIQVYATPVTSGSSNIILGYLDSGVSAPVVSNQFVTVDCGSIQLKENKKNATDYSPYTALSIYLPFIGIVELDVNECMNSTINVTYKVDVYTGTCLALVKITRTKDLPHGGILYTFNGNCSQQLPLTSGSATGVLSSLIGAVGSGLAIASGGGLGLVAGANLVGQTLNHEMLHVSHSGNISANAGIMGDKKPYLIISRTHGYDANMYNNFYGYPANKTVYLGNCNGFVRVKSCHVESIATEIEQNEIEQYLKAGVIL